MELPERQVTEGQGRVGGQMTGGGEVFTDDVGEEPCADGEED
jgi:hypothetical protein